MSDEPSETERARPGHGAAPRGPARRRAAPGTQRRRGRPPGAARRRGLRHRRDLHPLRRAARRGPGRRRHRALPLAPRLLQPAHRRGRARAGAQARRCVRGVERGRPGHVRGKEKRPATARRGRDGPRRIGGHRGRRGGGQLRGRGTAPRGLPGRDRAGRRGGERPTTGRTSPRTTWPATRPRSGSRFTRASSTRSGASSWSGAARAGLDPAAARR